jgi:pimeloyl-ACP methyl ester carboxylesterase
MTTPLDATPCTQHDEPATCQHAHDAEPPECSRRLVLADCLAEWRREATSGVADTGRYRCRYFAWGRGPTLVLVPGMASDAEAFVLLAARLKSTFRCVGFDLPDGRGDGARLRHYRHADHVADLVALLDHLRVQRSFLLGFSFGSTIALAALARHPQRFMRAVLACGFARRPLAPAEVLLASWARWWPGRLAQLPFARSSTEQMHRAPFEARDADVWEFFLRRHLDVPIAAFAQRALLVHKTDLRAQLPTIQQAVLLAVGDRDPLVGQAATEELRRGLPNVARAELENCGHQPHLTHPEVLAEVVKQFLAPSPFG